MATINLDKDTVLDYAGAAVLAYAAWTMMFGGEPIPVVGDLLKYLGTAAVFYMALKYFRRQ